MVADGARVRFYNFLYLSMVRRHMKFSAGWDDMKRIIEELRIEDPGGYYIIRNRDGDHGNSMLILQTSKQ